MVCGLLWDRLRFVVMASMSLVTMACGEAVFGATTLERYYAHKAVEDEHGVILQAIEIGPMSDMPGSVAPDASM